MRMILTIFAKEVRTYLRSPWFYFIVGLLTLIGSVIFVTQVAQFMMRSARSPMGVPTIHDAIIGEFIGILHFCLFFFVPAITARLFAEEKKMKSFDLLMTAPITSTQIVAGKILAGFWALFFILALTSLYPLSLSLLAPFEWGSFFSIYVGILLVGGCYVAIGVFTSSLTESMIVAWILAFVLNLGLWLLALFGQNTDQALVQNVVNHISVNYHFSNMMKGRLEIAGIVFLASVIGFFGFLAQRAVEAMRWR